MPVRKSMPIFLSLFAALSIAAAEMPVSFYQALGGMNTEDTICVKNYDAGASFTESYSGFEHLDKETQVISRSFNTSTTGDGHSRGNASLEASINSNVIGKAHIAWQSRDMLAGVKGRHITYSRTADDMTGAFDVEKVIVLWSNSTPGSVSLDWLPCS